MRHKFFLFLSLMVIALSAKATLPNTIEGKTFLFHVANIQNKDNPNATKFLSCILEKTHISMKQ